MLRASRRALRPGGRLAFHTIELATGLSPTERRRALAAGPPAVALRTSYPSLLGSAGFSGVDATDLTDEYAATQRRLLDAMRHHDSALRDALGDDTVDDGLLRRRDTLDAISAGLLCRTQYVATR